MNARAVVTLLAALCACGGSNEEEGGQVGFDIAVSAAAIDDIGEFQLVLLQSAAFSDCGEVARTCLNTQGKDDHLVTFEDGDGNKVKALRITNELTTAGGTRRQDTELRKVPVGKDYFLIIEALSRETTPKLLGTSCTQRVNVRAGQNERQSTNPISLFPGTGVECDPRIMK